MFLIDSHTNQLPNFSQNPIIPLVKRIVVIVPANTASSQQIFFPVDLEIDNAIIKGIRWEPGNVPETTQPGTVQFPNAVFYNLAQSIFVNLCDKHDNALIQQRPLISFAGYRNSPNIPAPINTGLPKVTPRFNINVMLKKCFIQFAPVGGGLNPLTPVYVVFSITYLPITGKIL